MRATIGLSVLAVAGALAACSGQQVSSTPPTVSYRVSGSDISQANANAATYCQRYGTTAYLQGVTNGTATYSCGQTTGRATAAAPATAVAPTAVAPVYNGTAQAPAYYSGNTAVVPGAAVQCADAMHQDRPGGTDYHGPAVAGCPQR